MQTAKLFKNGRSQAVRLPRQYRFEGSEVFVKRVGQAVLLIPYNEPWETLFDSLDLFTDDYMTRRDEPDQPERDSLFE